MPVQLVESPMARAVAPHVTEAILESVIAIELSGVWPELATVKVYGSVDPAVIPDNAPAVLVKAMLG